MSILLLSGDHDASRSLCAALRRAGREVEALTGFEPAFASVRAKQPRVIVVDASIPGHTALLDEAKRMTPWVRTHVLIDPGESTARVGLSTIVKPFDASEVAELLGRDVELAELERGRQSQELRAEGLSRLVEECLEAIVGLDAEGLVRSWNPGAESLYGYRADEAIGRHIGFVELEAESRAVRPEDGGRRMLEVKRRRKDGSEVLVLLSTSTLRDGDGPFRSVEVSLDITERKKLERELEHSERLAAIGRIAAGMAHEINNPLSVIQSCAVYFSDAAERIQDPELAESAADMELAVERIRSFVEHVCGFARRARPQLADTPIQTAVEVAVRMARPRALDAGVTLEVRADAGVSVPNDSPRLAQAILNVLSNAIDAAKMGGKHVWLSVESDAQAVRICVDDDGPGIANELAGKMFEPFATTKPYGQGTGLGLAITRQIMLDHRGSAQLSARESGGARAVLSLPKLVTGAHAILVLDPDPAVRRAVAHDFRREGFKVVSSDSIGSVNFVERDRAPSLVVSETRLKDAEGPELAERIRKAFPRARLLILTGDPARQSLPGAEASFSKPWHREELMSTARRLCFEAESMEPVEVEARSRRVPLDNR